MRQKIVAGNWKMHKNAEETEDLLNELIDKLPNDIEAHIIVAPTFVNLASASRPFRIYQHRRCCSKHASK